MAADPAALQLRLLQTVVEVSAEKNSTLIMPVPVELLRFFDRTAQTAGGERRAGAGTQDASGALPGLETPALAVPASLALNGSINATPKTSAAT
jgi:hypothetical protein